MTHAPFCRVIAVLAATLLAPLALTGCDDSNDDFDISRQIGADPVLPEPRHADPGLR